MNTFVDSALKEIENAEARTANGMKARKTAGSYVLDLFGKVGSARNVDLTQLTFKAYEEDPALTLRLLLWARDVRGGAGERKTFRSLVQALEKTYPLEVSLLIKKVPEVGRWDDLFAFQNPLNRKQAFDLIREALNAGNGLCAKWMPRKGPVAVELTRFLGLSPRQYRKLLVRLTNVVEQDMCAKNWDEINFEHVPSLAAARYQKAFGRHQPERYAKYIESLQKGEAKINAGAVYPYDIVQSVMRGNAAAADEQWKALPNYMDDTNVLPVVDVSGSMGMAATGSLTCLEIALSLGLYTSDKNSGAFKDWFITFSGESEMVHLKGNLSSKMNQMRRSSWGFNTNLHRAFERILNHAVKHNVPQEDMPKMLLILSDMQFDMCVDYDDSALQMIRRKYEKAGYEVPQIVFWNLSARYDNVPVKKNNKGVTLVSGFSPAIMKAILKAETFDPYSVMLDTLMVDRYNLV